MFLTFSSKTIWYVFYLCKDRLKRAINSQITANIMVGTLYLSNAYYNSQN